MKKTVALSLVFAMSVAVSAASHAQSDGMKGMEMKDMDKKPAAGATTAHKGTGVVKKVDAKAGTVMLAHDPVKSLDWPAMTMGFQVRDKKLLDKLAVDKKVEVELRKQGKDYVITSVK